jgi:hypothetical protein
MPSLPWGIKEGSFAYIYYSPTERIGLATCAARKPGNVDTKYSII